MTETTDKSILQKHLGVEEIVRLAVSPLDLTI